MDTIEHFSRRTWWGLVAGALTLAAGLPAVLHAQQPDLAGRWAMVDSNRALQPPGVGRLRTDTTSGVDSVGDTTGVKTDTADTRLPDSTRFRMPGEGRTPRGRYRGPSGSDREQMAQLLGMAEPPRLVTIAQQGDSLVFTNADGFSYVLHPDGRKDSLSLSDSVSVQFRSRWKDGNLTVEWKPTGGGSIDELYVLADSKLYLRYEVTIHAPGYRRPVWRVRMYRLAGQGEQGGQGG